MDQQTNETLQQVAEEIFESLAFVLPAFDEEDVEATPAAQRYAASIAFSGPFQGTLHLRIPAPMLEEVSVNMLGLDFGEVAPMDQQHDAFRELCNVICGNLLPRIAGDEAVFDLAVAEIGAADADPPAPPSNQAIVARTDLPLEGGVAELTLFTDRQQQQAAA
jgi:hypothetical protein